jgi:hypothetical protein
MTPDLFETDRMSDFEAFWARYPRHEAKKDALRAWTQLRPDDAVIDQIMTNLRVRSWPDQKRFIPLPASYLRGYRWTDDPLMGNQATPPANRWMPTPAKESRLIYGGMGIMCEHDPICETDLDHVRRVQAEKESRG